MHFTSSTAITPYFLIRSPKTEMQRRRAAITCNRRCIVDCAYSIGSDAVVFDRWHALHDSPSRRIMKMAVHYRASYSSPDADSLLLLVDPSVFSRIFFAPIVPQVHFIAFSVFTSPRRVIWSPSLQPVSCRPPRDNTMQTGDEIPNAAGHNEARSGPVTRRQRNLVNGAPPSFEKSQQQQRRNTVRPSYRCVCAPGVRSAC